MEGLSGSFEYTLSDDGTYYSVGAPNTDNPIDVPNTEIKGIVDIPSEYKGVPVTTIKRNGFANYAQISEVILPDSITAINEYAFSNCTGLKEITISNSVKEVWDGVFQGCEHLANVTLGNGISRIRAGVFSGCRGLIKMNIPNGVEIIEEEAFYGCNRLGNIVIPDSVTTIKERAFAYSGLTSITLGRNATQLGGYIFEDCDKLVEIINKSSVFIGTEHYTSVNGSYGLSVKQVIKEERYSKIIKQDDYIFYNDNGKYICLDMREGKQSLYCLIR